MKYKMKDLVDSITVGQIMSRVSYKDGEEAEAYKQQVQVLVPSAISGGVIHIENLGSAVLKKAVSDDRITQKNDIVIKLSSPYDCALITEGEEGLIIPSFCALIRGVDERFVDVRYFVGYLNSAYTTAKLVAGINSTAMAMLRGKSLAELDLEVPLINEQRIVGDAYWASCQRKKVIEQMVKQQQQISDSIIIETLKEVVRHERYSYGGNGKK